MDLLRAAMRDRIHQPYRASFVPGLEAMIALEGDGILGVALSGAGPSVIALVQGAGAPAGARMTGVFRAHGVVCRTYDLQLAETGLLREI